MLWGACKELAERPLLRGLALFTLVCTVVAFAKLSWTPAFAALLSGGLLMLRLGLIRVPRWFSLARTD
jgi:hypothetical protein